MNESLSTKMLRAAKERQEVPSTDNYNHRSSERLSNIGSKKIRTTMIGCISEVEKAFGELWGGPNKPYDEMTENEKDWFDLWQILRKNMLNLGNNQIRAFLNEVSQYTITWNRHMNVCPIKHRS